MRNTVSWSVAACLLLTGCADNANVGLPAPSTGGLNGPVQAIDINQYTFAGWRTATGTTVEFSADAAGLDFYRYRNDDCDIASILLCDAGAVDSLSSPPTAVTDSAATTTDSAWYQLGDDGALMRTRVNHDDHTFYGDLGTLWFDGAWWKIRGQSDGNTAVARTTDGQSWTGVTTSVPFSIGSATVFNDQLWVVDTRAGGAWRSEDGVNWTEVSTQLALPMLLDGQLVANDEYLFWIGGVDASDPATESLRVDQVWRSGDGASWSKVAEDWKPATLGDLGRYNTAVHNGELYTFLSGKVDEQSGAPGEGALFHATDGSDWAEIETGQSGSFAGAFSFRGQLWAARSDPGHQGSGDWWVSTDGSDWSPTGAPSRGMIVPGDRALLNQRTGTASLDGLNWATKPAIGPATDSAEVVSATWEAGDAIYVATRRFNPDTGLVEGGTLYRSEDFISWSEIGDSPFTANAQVVNRSDTWYAYETDHGAPASRVHSSADGVNWTVLADDLFAGSAKVGARFAALGDTLYLAGGTLVDTPNAGASSDEADAQILRSTDGISWTAISTSGAAPSRIFGGSLARIGDALFLLANGVAPKDIFELDLSTGVWTTHDGDATPAQHNAPVGESHSTSVVSIFQRDDGTLVWLSNGSGGTTSMSSTDGTNWSELDTGGETFGAFPVNDTKWLTTDSWHYLWRPSNYESQSAVWRAAIGALDHWEKLYTGVLIEAADAASSERPGG